MNLGDREADALNFILDEIVSRDEAHTLSLPDINTAITLSSLTNKEAHQIAIGYVYLPRFYTNVVHSLGWYSLIHVFLHVSEIFMGGKSLEIQ